MGIYIADFGIGVLSNIRYSFNGQERMIEPISSWKRSA